MTNDKGQRTKDKGQRTKLNFPSTPKFPYNTQKQQQPNAVRLWSGVELGGNINCSYRGAGWCIRWSGAIRELHPPFRDRKGSHISKET
ncbi:hypothetical protein [[Phormidium] sp. ETS-05]|uniref:hypothetical protein n=1 Tax=[Phormidium] sp. ETS-05 TaxID=222819 RepID=UPI0018EECE4D|nr:hypothetical protein [[Phormidium] sp. ETS-05]